jgi:hypothetical protein
MNYFPSQIQFEPHNKLSSFNTNLMEVLGGFGEGMATTIILTRHSHPRKKMIKLLC